MDPHTAHHPDPESDLLLGILDILDSDLFLKAGLQEAAAAADPEQQQQQQLVLVGSAGQPLPAAAPGALGPAPVKLEALNELIQFDHVYTRPAEERRQESEEEEEEEVKMEEEEVQDEVFSLSQEEVEVETVSVKDEPEEELVPVAESVSVGVDEFLSSSLGELEKTAYLTADSYSDSGYERSPSPFSDMSSPLCADASWDDMFANELFPQLISV